MARAGRKRKEGVRYPSGDIHRSQYEPAILQRTLEIRGAVVGMEYARDAKASYLIGQMELSGRVVPEQYLAALKTGYIWGMHERILSMELNAPRRNVSCVQFYGASLGRSCDVIDDEKIAEIRSARQEIDDALKKNIRPWLLARGILDGVIMENDLPPSMDRKRQHPFFAAHWAMFRYSLDVLAEYFGIEERRSR